MSIHLKLFIGHKPPDFGVWPGFTYASQKGGDFPLPTDPKLDQITSNVLSEYLSLFMLRRKLEAEDITDGLITICQHRRFVLNTAMGVKALNLPTTQMINAQAATGLNTELLMPVAGEYLIASPLVLRNSILNHYHVHHQLRDLLRFLSDLIDAQLLDTAGAHTLLNMNVLIPGPGCGVFPIKTFLKIFALLEKCTLAWHASGYVPRTEYQARSTGFMLERLNSYLLINYLIETGVDFEKVVGHTTVVSESNVLIPGR
jgi:hypothetical protein